MHNKPFINSNFKTMKKNLKFLTAMFAFMAFFTSCESEDDDLPVDPDPVEEAEVGITSFGFYQEDNSDLLLEDYVDEDISGMSIDIALPAEIDVTDLVARFTTTSGDEVSIQGESQVSGETSNDFSNSKEYLVSEGDTNVIYTVSVSKMASAIWNRIGVYDEDVASDISLAIDPTSSAPYIGYISDRENFDDRKLNLVGYEDNAWTRVGAADFSGGRARSIDLSFSPNGTPYIAFGDDSGDQTEAAVMTYDNSWGYVGTGSFTDGIRSTYTTVSVGEDEQVYAFYNNDQIGDDNRRNIFGKTFSSGSWSDLNITGRSGMSRFVRSQEVGGDVYVSILDYGNGQAFSAYKYSDGSWETLAEKMKEAEENTVYYYDIAMSVDKNGNVYMAYVEKTPESDYQIRVKKYSEESSSWSTVGDLINTTNYRTLDITVDGYGDPVLLFTNDSYHPTIATFDSEVNNWAGEEVLESVEATDMNIETAPNGVVYASYVVDDLVHLNRYASPDQE